MSRLRLRSSDSQNSVRSTNRGTKSCKMSSNISVNRWLHNLIRVLHNRETAITLTMWVDRQQVRPPHRQLRADTHSVRITTRVKNNYTHLNSLRVSSRTRSRNRDPYPQTTSIMSLSKRTSMKMRKRKMNIILEPPTRVTVNITTSPRKMKILTETKQTTTCPANKI